MVPDTGNQVVKPPMGAVSLEDILGGKIPAVPVSQDAVPKAIPVIPENAQTSPVQSAPPIMTPVGVQDAPLAPPPVHIPQVPFMATETIQTSPPVFQQQNLFTQLPQQAPQQTPTQFLTQQVPQMQFPVQQAPQMQFPAQVQMQPQMQFPAPASMQLPQYQQPQQMMQYQQPPLQLPSTVSAPPQGGFMWTGFGTEVQRYPINRFKASVGPTYRIGIISREIAVVKTHWMDDFGYFYCFGGKCDEVIGMPYIRYIVPIVLYDTDKVGQITSVKFDIMYLSLADDEYKALKSLDANVPIDSLDFIVTCSDEKYQALHMQNVGPATWKQYPQYNAMVTEKWNQVRTFLPLVIARNMTEANFTKLTSGVVEPTQQQLPRHGTNLASFIK